MVDEKDRSILDALGQDGRTPFTALARQLHISETAVRQRVARMQASGVLRIVALCNPLSLGHQPVRLLVQIRDTTPRAIAASLMSMPGINHVALIAGAHDLYVEATCRDEGQLVGLLDQVRMISGVDGIETPLLLELFKDYSWNGLVNAVGRNVTGPAE